MKLCTWNINSVRLRAPIVVKLMREQSPDIVCLQETKCPDEFFPSEIFAAEGYIHQHVHGMKSYNGVGILSKIPFEARDIYHRCGREDCRHIAARVGDFELHNIYIPAGGDVPDPAVNEKFAHKLSFVDELSAWFASRYTAEDRLIAVGDFNIAPLENDVWSHKQLLSVVSHTPIEVGKMTEMYASLDWQDAVRRFVPADEKCYTWWSYRNADWRASNRGRRLDHIWTTRSMIGKVSGYHILKEARDWDKPSDHVPVIVDINN